MELKERTARIIARLKELFPNADIALNYGTPFELLVAVILSAQCTDKLVNKVTAGLFPKYRTLDDYADADPVQFETDIRSVNFYRNKAKNIRATAQIIRDQHGGRVPDTMEELTALPGVARKTANVILSVIYGKAEGIVVDTHVKRLSKLYGLTQHDDPVKVERDLVKLVPREDWKVFSFLMIEYGRAYCPARPHDHDKCPLNAVV